MNATSDHRVVLKPARGRPIVIGCAWLPHPPQLTADGETMQRALLSRVRTRPTWLQRLLRLIFRG